MKNLIAFQSKIISSIPNIFSACKNSLINTSVRFQVVKQFTTYCFNYLVF